MRTELAWLKKPIMQRLLGRDYDTLLAMERSMDYWMHANPYQQQPLQAMPAATQNARILAPVAGVKRKADDIVDLTGDASD